MVRIPLPAPILRGTFGILPGQLMGVSRYRNADWTPNPVVESSNLSTPAISEDLMHPDTVSLLVQASSSDWPYIRPQMGGEFWRYLAEGIQLRAKELGNPRPTIDIWPTIRHNNSHFYSYAMVIEDTRPQLPGISACKCDTKAVIFKVMDNCPLVWAILAVLNWRMATSGTFNVEIVAGTRRWTYDGSTGEMRLRGNLRPFLSSDISYR